MKKIGIWVAVIAFIVVFPHSFIANAQNVPPPTVPTGVSAYITQAGQVYVSWNPASSTIGIEGYYLYRDGQEIANTPGLLFYTDNAPAGSHTYSVSAYDSEGNTSGQSAPSQVITLVQDQPPTAPTNITFIPSSSSVAFSWDAATDNIAVIGYYIYRNGQKLILQNAITGTSFTDTGLATGYTYSYQIGAYNAQGYITRSAPINVTTIFDITPPSAPSNVTAKAISSSEIDLSWHPATDNIAVVNYAVYRNSQLLGYVNGTSTTYADTGLSANTLYSYQIQSVDEVGNVSTLSIPPATASTQPQDLTPPSIPSNIQYVSPSTSEIDLSWHSSTDNVGVAGYYIYRDGNEIGSTASTTYADTGLATDTTYQYAIKAYDAAGNISPQQSIGATTLINNPVAPMQTSTPPQVPPSSPPPSTPPYSPPSTPPQTPMFTFTTGLYFGMRGANIVDLQTVLIAQGDLGSQYATGYFGLLTQAGVQKFQCSKGIVCSGSPYTNGYGSVGPRTRAALNSL